MGVAMWLAAQACLTRSRRTASQHVGNVIFRRGQFSPRTTTRTHQYRVSSRVTATIPPEPTAPHARRPTIAPTPAPAACTRKEVANRAQRGHILLSTLDAGRSARCQGARVYSKTGCRVCECVYVMKVAGGGWWWPVRHGHVVCERRDFKLAGRRLQQVCDGLSPEHAAAAPASRRDSWSRVKQCCSQRRRPAGLQLQRSTFPYAAPGGASTPSCAVKPPAALTSSPKHPTAHPNQPSALPLALLAFLPHRHVSVTPHPHQSCPSTPTSPPRRLCGHPLHFPLPCPAQRPAPLPGCQHVLVRDQAVRGLDVPHRSPICRRHPHPHLLSPSSSSSYRTETSPTSSAPPSTPLAYEDSQPMATVSGPIQASHPSPFHRASKIQPRAAGSNPHAYSAQVSWIPSALKPAQTPL